MRSIRRCASLAGILVLGALLASGARAQAQTDPLPSWNDGPAKQAILSFVKETTDQASPRFVPPAERIATFDQDGTQCTRCGLKKTITELDVGQVLLLLKSLQPFPTETVVEECQTMMTSGTPIVGPTDQVIAFVKRCLVHNATQRSRSIKDIEISTCGGRVRGIFIDVSLSDARKSTQAVCHALLYKTSEREIAFGTRSPLNEFLPPGELPAGLRFFSRAR